MVEAEVIHDHNREAAARAREDGKEKPDQLETREPLLFECGLAHARFEYYLELGIPEMAHRWLLRGREAAHAHHAKSGGADRRALHGDALRQAIFMAALDRTEDEFRIIEETLKREKTLFSSTRRSFELRWATTLIGLDLRTRILEAAGIDLNAKGLSAWRAEEAAKPPGLADPVTLLKNLIQKGEGDVRDLQLAAMKLANYEITVGRSESAVTWMERARSLEKEKAGHAATSGYTTRSAMMSAFHARALLSSGASKERLESALDELDTEYLAMLEQLRSIPFRKGGAGFLYFDGRRRVVSELVRLILAVHPGEEGRRRALDRVLRAQSLGSLARHLGVEPVDLEEVKRRLLAPGSGILIFLPAYEQSHVFVLDSEGILVREIPSELVLDEYRRNLDGWLWNTHGHPFDEAAWIDVASPLRDALLPPEILERIDEWDEITVTGLDIIGWTPLECVPLASGESLGLAKAVDWLPSLALGVHLDEVMDTHRAADRGRKAEHSGIDSKGPETLLLIAPQTARDIREYDRTLDPIELDGDEMDAFKRAVAKRSHEILEGEDAVKARLTGGDLESVRVLCLFAHGARQRASAVEAEDDDEILPIERPARLILAPSKRDDGLLTPDEVDALRLSSMVILSACGTATGPRRYGDDGINHFGGAFMRAGAPVVVLTPKKLEIHATAALTARFLEGLVHEGRSPVQAMREARRGGGRGGEVDPSLLPFHAADRGVGGTADIRHSFRR